MMLMYYFGDKTVMVTNYRFHQIIVEMIFFSGGRDKIGLDSFFLAS